MQRLKTIWRDSPFSWQGIKARWRWLSAVAAGILILIGVGSALKFRSSPAEVTTDPFTELASEQQRYLSKVELSFHLEQLRTLVREQRDDEAARLYNQISAGLEGALTPEHWLELEPHLTTLGAHLSRGDADAEEELGTLITLLQEQGADKPGN